MSIPLENYLVRAAEAGAGTLLLLPGQKPVCRIGRELQPPLSESLLSPDDTLDVAEEFLTDQMREQLELGEDHVERPFLVGEVSGRVTIFLGMGVPHLVFHLDPRI